MIKNEAPVSPADQFQLEQVYQIESQTRPENQQLNILSLRNEKNKEIEKTERQHV